MDGSIYDLAEDIPLNKNQKHNIEIVVDRLIMKEDLVRRLTDSIEIASSLSERLIILHIPADGQRDYLQPELRLRGLRRVAAGAEPAHVLFQ